VFMRGLFPGFGFSPRAATARVNPAGVGAKFYDFICFSVSHECCQARERTRRRDLIYVRTAARGLRTMSRELRARSDALLASMNRPSRLSFASFRFAC